MAHGVKLLSIFVIRVWDKIEKQLEYFVTMESSGVELEMIWSVSDPSYRKVVGGVNFLIIILSGLSIKNFSNDFYKLI